MTFLRNLVFSPLPLFVALLFFYFGWQASWLLRLGLCLPLWGMAFLTRSERVDFIFGEDKRFSWKFYFNIGCFPLLGGIVNIIRLA